MDATRKNIVHNSPVLEPDAPVCKRYLRFPDLTGARQGEGGLRLQDNYKASLINKPLVSIVTVVYNRAKKLERAMQSIFNQAYDNIEYIVIDGGSTDGTFEVIQKHENSIDYYISEPDSGIYHAMNKGLELATGDYIAMLNSDDWYIDEAVELSISGLMKAGADYSVAEAVVVDQNGQAFGRIETRHFDELAFFSKIPCCHGTMFISSNAYNMVGKYDENYRIAADFKMQLLLIQHNFKVAKSQEKILHFDCSGVSSDTQIMLDDLFPLLKNFNPELDVKDVWALVKIIHAQQWDENVESLVKKVFNSNYYNSRQKDFLEQRVKCFRYTGVINRWEQICNRPILVWGTGNGGKYTLDWLKNVGANVVGFIDSNPTKWNEKFSGLLIYSPDSVAKDKMGLNPPYIVIGSGYIEEIVESLMKLGYQVEQDFCFGKTSRQSVSDHIKTE